MCSHGTFTNYYSRQSVMNHNVARNQVAAHLLLQVMADSETYGIYNCALRC